MQISLRLKIKVGIIVTLAIALFMTVGWAIAKPLDPEGPISLIASNQPTMMIGGAIVMSLLITIVAMFISGKYSLDLAPLAVPVGIASLSLLGSGMRMLNISHSTVAERSSMYSKLAGETFFWFALVTCGFLAAYGLHAFLTSKTGESLGKDHITAELDEAIGRKFGVFQNKWVSYGAALLISCIVASIVIRIVLQSGNQSVSYQDHLIEVMSFAAKGQIFFAVFLAFLAGALAAEQLLGVPVWSLMPGPLIVAIIAYVKAGQTSVLEPLVNSSPAFIMSSAKLGMVLPIQYIGIGTLAIFVGYWISVRMKVVKKYTLEELAEAEG